VPTVIAYAQNKGKIMARKSDSIGTFFDYGLDASTRTLYIGSIGTEGVDNGVDYKMAEYAIKGLDILDRSEGPIRIRLNTIGGDEYQGLAIYDAISLCKNQVSIIGMGNIMSMGAWVIQAADERIMTPNATMMVHYGIWSYEGHSMDYLQWAKELSRLNKLMEDTLLARIREKHPKFSAAKFRRQFLFDSFLSAQEALDLGLIDRVAQ